MNMSYCRFENTLNDLNDCETALNEFIQCDENVISSDRERNKAKKLIELCKYIAENYEETDIDRQAEMFGKQEEEE